MRKIVEGRKIYNIFYLIAIFIVLISCFFSNKLSVLLYLKPDYEFVNKTEIHFINVGQGDAIAIKFDSGKTMLIDTGTSDYQKKLETYLNNIVLKGSRKIDYLVLTHIDKDHSGNMMFLLDNYDIGIFYRPPIYASFENYPSYNTSSWYDTIIDRCYDKNINMVFNEKGNVLSEGFTELKWLSPIGIEHNESIDSNDFSPVIRLDYNGHSALFTGDISSEQESLLINNYSSNILDVDILKLAHHGSNTSTSSGFLNITSPEIAVISVGKNSYGHPSNAVIERILEYDKINCKKLYSNIYTTLDSGNVILTLTSEISVKTIANIDNYSFVSYAVYAMLFILIIIVFMLKPYYKVWKKNIRFVIQNKKFKQIVELEKIKK